MNFALAIAADNLNYTTVVTYGGALCGVQQGAHGRVSSARQVWEADATRRVIENLLDEAFCENMPSTVYRFVSIVFITMQCFLDPLPARAHIARGREGLVR